MLMTHPELNRRDRMRAAIAGAGAPTAGKPRYGAQRLHTRLQTTQPLHVVCVGGHPDDPESGCGGTWARYAEAGHQVSVVYLTGGERGIPGKSDEQAAATRTAECEAACKIL